MAKITVLPSQVQTQPFNGLIYSEPSSLGGIDGPGLLDSIGLSGFRIFFFQTVKNELVVVAPSDYVVMLLDILF